MGALLSWIEARAAERSTWTGLVALLSAFGLALQPDKAQAIVALGVAVGGAIHVFTADKPDGKAD